MDEKLLHPETAEKALLAPGRLRSLWELRHAGRVEEAYDAYLDLLGELSVTLQNNSDAWAALRAKGCSRAEAREILLLELSFLRNRRELDQAESRLQALEQITDREGLRLSASQLLQRALNRLGAGKHAEALEDFLRSKRAAKDPMERSLGAFNALLCLEDLGLEFGPSLDSFLAEFASLEGEPWAASIIGQLDAFRLRHAFRNGNQAELRACLERPLRGEQSLYFAAWLAELPCLPLAGLRASARALFSASLGAAGMSYHSAARLRTLNGLLVEEDLGPAIRLSELIERLYLWTWRFLLSADPVVLEKILVLQGKIRERRECLSGDDFAMLDLSLRWLGLLGGLTESEQEKLLVRHTRAEARELPHFSEESRLLKALAALRRGSRFAGDLRADFLASARAESPFRSLLGDGGAFGELGETIRSWSEPLQPAEATVEVLKRTVRVRGRELVSEPLTLLLELFRADDHATKARLLRHVFQIREPEPGVHDPKLANLLSKANGELEGIAKFSVKGQQVIARVDRGRLRFRECDAHARAFTRMSLEPLLGKSPARSAPPAHGKEWLSRAEIESTLRVSKATAARLLKAGVERRQVASKGSGRSTLYKILEPSFLPAAEAP